MYNASSYIERCLSSIVCQSYDDFEVVLVDDGSNDDSFLIACGWSEKDRRIKVFQQKNQGPAIARNLALDKCTGEFYVFIDVDDFIKDTFFKNALEAINERAGLYSFSHYESVGVEPYHVIPCIDVELSNDSITTLIMDAVDKGMSLTYLWDKIYRADIIRKNNIRFPNTRRGEDFVFNMSFLQYCNDIKLVNKPYYYYKKNINSISLGFQKHYILSNTLMIDSLKNIYQQDQIPDNRFVKYAIHEEIQGRVFGTIGNYLYNKTVGITLSQKYEILKEFIWKDNKLMGLFRQHDECVVLNQRIIRFLMLYTNFYITFVYNYYIGILKKIKMTFYILLYALLHERWTGCRFSLQKGRQENSIKNAR